MRFISDCRLEFREASPPALLLNYLACALEALEKEIGFLFAVTNRKGLIYLVNLKRTRSNL